MLKRRVLALVDEKQVVYKRVNTSLINNEGAAAIVLSYYPDCKACYHSACSCETLGCKPHDSSFGRWQSGRLRGVDTYLINNEEAAAIVLSYYLNWKVCCHSTFSYGTMSYGTSLESRMWSCYLNYKINCYTVNKLIQLTTSYHIESVTWLYIDIYFKGMDLCLVRTHVNCFC